MAERPSWLHGSRPLGALPADRLRGAVLRRAVDRGGREQQPIFETEHKIAQYDVKTSVACALNRSARWGARIGLARSRIEGDGRYRERAPRLRPGAAPHAALALSTLDSRRSRRTAESRTGVGLFRRSLGSTPSTTRPSVASPLRRRGRHPASSSPAGPIKHHHSCKRGCPGWVVSRAATAGSLLRYGVGYRSSPRAHGLGQGLRRRPAGSRERLGRAGTSGRPVSRPSSERTIIPDVLRLRGGEGGQQFYLTVEGRSSSR